MRLGVFGHALKIKGDTLLRRDYPLNGRHISGSHDLISNRTKGAYSERRHLRVLHLHVPELMGDSPEHLGSRTDAALGCSLVRCRVLSGAARRVDLCLQLRDLAGDGRLLVRGLSLCGQRRKETGHDGGCG